MATRKQMISNLESLGLGEAIADPHATVNGYPAILLRWNGKEEYYTGYDILEPGDDPSDGYAFEYQEWLKETFTG